MIIDSQITAKIKRALADYITTKIDDNSTKSEASVNVTSIIDILPTDTVNKPNNANDETCDAIVAETILKEIITKYFMEWIQSIRFFNDDILQPITSIKIFHCIILLCFQYF